MAIVKYATVEGVRPSGKAGGFVALVHLVEIDPDLLGKALQLGRHEEVSFATEADVAKVIAERYPEHTYLASDEARGVAVERLLIDEDLRERDQSGKIVATPRAKAMERGEPDPGKRLKEADGIRR